MSSQQQISCPHCGRPIDVNEVLSHQLEESLKRKFAEEAAEARKSLLSEQKRLEHEKELLEKAKAEQSRHISEAVINQVKAEKLKLEESIKVKIHEEQKSRMEVIEKELKEKSEQVKELNRTKAEMERLKREKDEMKEALEAENARKLNAQLFEEREKIRKAEQEKNELVFLELRKQLDDQKKLTEEMKRKQEQGSMQLQGEVQELAMEDWLKKQFPLDTIEEIKKGDRGADCVQIINTHGTQHCGTIYYESKRTKEFKPAWIEKFRDDIRARNADTGVLVTDVFPKGMERMGNLDGIWICSFEEFKGLSAVLRESLIQLNSLTLTQENKGEKMNMLYDFLISSEFRQQVEGIVEGFVQMQTDLNAEKRSIMGHWKKREKQIQKVLLNTNHMYNSIKGIAGAAIQPIKTLELPDADNEEIEE